jgi:hypothetical protein
MKDLEFHVSSEKGGYATKIHKTFPKACADAISQAASSGITMYIDVVTWTKAAARSWAGNHGVEVYEEDPDASVHERIVITADSQGRVA